MEKIGGRKHSPETQYEIRKQVVRLRKQGIPNKVLAVGVGISISVGRASKIEATRRRATRPSSWGDAVVVKGRIEPLAKNKRRS